MQNIFKALTTVSILALAGAVIFATFTFQQLKNRELSNEAQVQCASAYRYTKTETNGVSVSYPMEELYQKCLTQKK